MNEDTATRILRIPFSEVIHHFNSQCRLKGYRDWEATFKDGFGGGANGTAMFGNKYKDDPKLLAIVVNAREAGCLFRTYMADNKPELIPQVHESDGPRPMTEQLRQHVGPEEVQSVSDVSTSAHIDFALPDLTVNTATLDVSTQDGAKPSCVSIDTHTDLPKAGQKRNFADVIDLTGSDEEAASEEQRPAKRKKLGTRLRPPKV